MRGITNYPAICNHDGAQPCREPISTAAAGLSSAGTAAPRSAPSFALARQHGRGPDAATAPTCSRSPRPCILDGTAVQDAIPASHLQQPWVGRRRKFSALAMPSRSAMRAAPTEIDVSFDPGTASGLCGDRGGGRQRFREDPAATLLEVEASVAAEALQRRARGEGCAARFWMSGSSGCELDHLKDRRAAIVVP